MTSKQRKVIDSIIKAVQQHGDTPLCRQHLLRILRAAKKLGDVTVLILLSFIMFGCRIDPYDDLNRGIKPIVVVACSHNGLVLQDAEGSVFVYSGNCYITLAACDSGLKAGDVFATRSSLKHGN